MRSRLGGEGSRQGRRYRLGGERFNLEITHHVPCLLPTAGYIAVLHLSAWPDWWARANWPQGTHHHASTASPPGDAGVTAAEAKDRDK